jgi:hypothetical protein
MPNELLERVKRLAIGRMNEFEPEHIDEDQLRLPPQLVRELKSLHAPPVGVPSKVDDRLLAEAKAGCNSLRSKSGSSRSPSGCLGRLRPRWWLGYPLISSCRIGVPGDLNRDGRCDVLDAFSLARRLQQGGAQDPALDINGDGLVDQHDVETLLARAVRLKKEKRHG